MGAGRDRDEGAKPVRPSAHSDQAHVRPTMHAERVRPCTVSSSGGPWRRAPAYAVIALSVAVTVVAANAGEARAAPVEHRTAQVDDRDTDPPSRTVPLVGPAPHGPTATTSTRPPPVTTTTSTTTATATTHPSPTSSRPVHDLTTAPPVIDGEPGGTAVLRTRRSSPYARPAAVALAASIALTVLRVISRVKRRRRPERHRDHGAPSGGTGGHRRRPGDDCEVEAVVVTSDVLLFRWAGNHLADLRNRLDRHTVSTGPVAVEISEVSGIEVLWDAPQADAPQPWQIADGGWAWRLPYDPDAAVPAASLAHGIPALAAIGERDGRRLFVDLEAYGSVTVGGPAEKVDTFLRCLAIDLAGSEGLADADVLAVGIDAGIGSLDRLTAASTETATSALERATACFTGSRKSRRPSRTFHGGAASVPIEATVIVANALDPSQVDHLVALCPARRGVALVVAGSEGIAPAHIEIDHEGGARLSPLGIEFESAGVDRPTASGMNELRTVPQPESEAAEVVVEVRDIADDSSHGRGERAEPQTTNGHVIEMQTVPEVLPDLTVEAREPALVVHVLGTPSVPDRPDIGRRELIVTTYLACREGPVAASAVQDALWSGKPVETKTVWNVIGATRRALGDLDDGRPALPAADRSRGGSLQLAAGATTDLALLRQLVDRADSASSSEAIELLREGLSFVTGPPFDAVGYDWAHRDQDVAEASTLIEQAAERLVELALEAGHVDIAREAVVRGLRGLPGNEELYRCRMCVEHHAGNLAGVTAAYEELVTYLDDLETEPSPATSALFHDLARPAVRR